MISFHHQSRHPQTASLASPGVLPHGSKIAALFANITTLSGRKRQPELQESHSFMLISYQGEKSFPGALQKYFHLSPSGRTGSYGQSWLQRSLGKQPSGMLLLYAGHLSASITAEVVHSAIVRQKQEEWLLGRRQHSCLGWYMVGIWHHHTAHSAYVPRAHWRESMTTDKTVYYGIHKDLGQRPQLKPFNTVILCWILTEIFQSRLDTPASYKVL